MIKIYINGCTTCGVNSVYIRRIQKYGLQHDIPVEIIESKYSTEARYDHLHQLKNGGYSLDTFKPIVVFNGEVIRLRAWNYS